MGMRPPSVKSYFTRATTGLSAFFAWWVGLFVLLSATGSVCPCCGKPTCPGGVLGSGLLSGLAAGLLYLPRAVVRLLRRISKPRSQ